MPRTAALDVNYDTKEKQPILKVSAGSPVRVIPALPFVPLMPDGTQAEPDSDGNYPENAYGGVSQYFTHNLSDFQPQEGKSVTVPCIAEETDSEGHEYGAKLCVGCHISPKKSVRFAWVVLALDASSGEWNELIWYFSPKTFDSLKIAYLTKYAGKMAKSFGHPLVVTKKSGQFGIVTAEFAVDAKKFAHPIYDDKNYRPTLKPDQFLPMTPTDTVRFTKAMGVNIPDSFQHFLSDTTVSHSNNGTKPTNTENEPTDEFDFE